MSAGGRTETDRVTVATHRISCICFLFFFLLFVCFLAQVLQMLSWVAGSHPLFLLVCCVDELLINRFLFCTAGLVLQYLLVTLLDCDWFLYIIRFCFYRNCGCVRRDKTM